ncbi:hypothetical protein K402DRAFT_422068 [Aulographum hederae CBS 113979]|uniref:ATPase n=1 Tax=Aulographum hederae CBS 113979 TaxID=1176131 RepID=A0A6G1GXA5_9PEZI|nr:hypothetical protein K402DRAFT_422068 [Aulographum hederae CBS 113979]
MRGERASYWNTYILFTVPIKLGRAGYAIGKGRRGSGRGRGNHIVFATKKDWSGCLGPNSESPLNEVLEGIERYSYAAYKQLVGIKWELKGPPLTLVVDHVQQDPYAPPSSVRAVMKLEDTGIPTELYQKRIRRVALTDYISRRAGDIISDKSYDKSQSTGRWQEPKGGDFTINAPKQEVLPRSSCIIKLKEGTVELRFTVGLPARGREIMGKHAAKLLCDFIPEIASGALLFANQYQQRLERHILSVEDQDAMRQQLDARGLVSDGVVAFQSPQNFEVVLDRPNGGPVTGMGIPRGITLLTGGGFHGKSTLLEAIQYGVYDHIPGDGRELVVTDSTAAVVKAEDGRSVTGTDITQFIDNLPGGKSTKRFTTEDASGFTSMASSLREAIELGSRTLLIDEDNSATNLLVRDSRMYAHIPNEPITPLITRIRAMITSGTNLILVVGGLGDWLSVADHIIGMDNYIPRDLKHTTAAILKDHPTVVVESPQQFPINPRRISLANVAGKDQINPAKRNRFLIAFARGDNERALDLSHFDHIVEEGQVLQVAWVLHQLCHRHELAEVGFTQAAQLVEGPGFDFESMESEKIGAKGNDAKMLYSGQLVAVRPIEVGMAVARTRGFKVL